MIRYFCYFATVYFALGFFITGCARDGFEAAKPKVLKGQATLSDESAGNNAADESHSNVLAQSPRADAIAKSAQEQNIRIELTNIGIKDAEVVLGTSLANEKNTKALNVFSLVKVEDTTVMVYGPVKTQTDGVLQPVSTKQVYYDKKNKAQFFKSTSHRIDVYTHCTNRCANIAVYVDLVQVVTGKGQNVTLLAGVLYDFARQKNGAYTLNTSTVQNRYATYFDAEKNLKSSLGIKP